MKGMTKEVSIINLYLFKKSKNYYTFSALLISLFILFDNNRFFTNFLISNFTFILLFNFIFYLS